MNLEETMPLVFERSIPGRIGFSLPESDVPETKASDYFEQAYIRSVPADLPELSKLKSCVIIPIYPIITLVLILVFIRLALVR